MPDNFQQIINLKERVEKRKKELERQIREEAEAAMVRSAVAEKEPDFLQEREPEKAEIMPVRPAVRRRPLGYKLLKLTLAVLVLSVAAVAAYSLFFDHSALLSRIFKDNNWYLVKLANGEIFYGQIVNTKADPIVMLNVYYNYDQANAEKKDANAAGGLRLIRRGQETHGPDGTMDIVRSQVLIMERLKSDSPMLKAMLEYEKKIRAAQPSASASPNASVSSPAVSP